MSNKINIGIIGLGNVGSAVADNIKKNHKLILENSGFDLCVKKVCDLRKIKSPYPLTSDPYNIINDPEIDIVVEAIGGVKPALKLVLAALKQGKHIVTPNKELIAKHMKEIMSVAKQQGVKVLFEAAVGGGIPIIQPLRESLAVNRLSEIFGIVNGTTNYILTKMDQEGMEFSVALKKAQEKGYAEPNPAADIKGFDAAYKAVILTSVAFGAEVNLKDVYVEGITGITQEDIQYAKDIGYVVKPLAIARMVEGQLDVRVHPALVARTHPLASVSENYNAIYVKGKPVGQVMFYGPGAGGGPTASAVISDIVKIAVGEDVGPSRLKSIRVRKIGEIKSRYYLRLQTLDRAGVLAGIAKAFAKQDVSIAAVMQKETVGDVATIVILLHCVAEKNLRAALDSINKLAIVKKVSSVIRIIS